MSPDACIEQRCAGVQLNRQGRHGMTLRGFPAECEYADALVEGGTSTPRYVMGYQLRSRGTAM